MSEQGKVEQEGGEALHVELKADFSAFKAKLNWMSSLLKSRNVFESLSVELRARLQGALDGTCGNDEIAKLGLVTAGAAGEWIVNVEAGPLLVELESALRALGFEFHEGSCVVEGPRPVRPASIGPGAI